jgi:hypothetical protein
MSVLVLLLRMSVLVLLLRPPRRMESADSDRRIQTQQGHSCRTKTQF